ncbi:MAG: ribonuclease Z [Chloroflexi bacterium]|nr:ribonuclease Z [Chloroflexota bacterium]
MIRFTILGAGTGVPMPQRSPAGVLVQIGATPLLFDLGPGTIPRLDAAGVSYRDLEFVFLTHLHPDHTLDLVMLLQALNYTPSFTRERPLRLFGCVGTRALYDDLLRAYPSVAPRGFELTIRELSAERIAFDAWTIETAPSAHTATSIAYRIEAEDKALVYTGDAKENPALIEIARDADAFVCECAFPRGYATRDHMTADAVGRVARAARVKRVILNHLYPPALEVDVVAQVRAEYAGEIIVAEDGTRIQV